MNIIFFIGNLKHGGAEGVVATLTSELAHRGHRITLVCSLRNQFYEVSDAVNIINVCSWQYNTSQGRFLVKVYNKIANRFLDLIHIKRVIQKEHPDVVISFLVNWLWQIIVLCKGRIPIACAERNAMVFPHTSKNFWNKQILYRFADVVQVMSRYDKAWLRNRYKRVVAMPNPLRFTPLTMNEYEKIFDTRKNILACGRINPQKGFDKLIQAFALIAQQYPDWDIDICGNYTEDDNYYVFLQKIIQNNKLKDRVHFLGQRRDVDKVMKSHSVFVLSSQHEGFPNVLSEAMANGMACVSFDIVTGPSEIINDGLDGMIVEDQNVEALALGMAALLKDNELRFQYGKKAIENIARYNKNIIVDKWEQFFNSTKQ